MAPKYEVGQRVIIMPVKEQHLSPRDTGLEAYTSQIGKITDYYWINRGTDVFYIYTVQTETDQKEVVLHEDELGAYIA